MEEEDLNTLGFQHKVTLGEAAAVDPRARKCAQPRFFRSIQLHSSKGHTAQQLAPPLSPLTTQHASTFTGREVIAGLGAAKTKKGFFGGWGSGAAPASS